MLTWWLRNQQETPRSTHVVWLNCGRPTWDIKNILYIWFSYFTLTETHRCQNYFMLYFNKKKMVIRVDQGNRKPSLKLLACGRKTQNDVHIDTYYRKPEPISWTVFHARFLSPTDQKYAESSTYWQFFYYRQPGKFTLGEIVVKMFCQEHNIYIYIYITLSIMIDCTIFHSFFSSNVWIKRFFRFSKVGRTVIGWRNG